jgi:tetratricopeptide (TPR) repeat protein
LADRLARHVALDRVDLSVDLEGMNQMKRGRRARFASPGYVWSVSLLVAAALAAVLWAIAQVLGWPVWARALLAGLAAVVAVIVPQARAWFGQRNTREQLVDQGVAVSGGRGRLPRVREVSLNQLRVHAARVQVPFIERDQQDKLEAAVGPGQAVLVVGHSMSGKTRLAAEVVKQKFPDVPLVVPESGKALRELFDGGLDPAGLVVWLDDLERFLGVDGLTVGLLNRLITSRAIVVATIRLEQRETYRPRDQLRPPEWEEFQRFSEILLQRRLTESELGRVRASVDVPDVLAAVDYYGLGEYLGAGPEALDKFEKGENAEPVGYALVRAAVDWRRSGLSRPVSKEVLVAALPTYLSDRPDVPRSNEVIEKGLVWATKKINEMVALLGQDFTSSNGPVFEVFDYLIDQPTITNTPVPDPMWALVLEEARSFELMVIGFSAYFAGKSDTTEAAFRRAANEGNFELASGAAYVLGDFLYEQGDLEGAKAAYQQAIAGGDADAVPRAASGLESLLVEQGDVEGAKLTSEIGGYPDYDQFKAFYQQAIASGHADAAPWAANTLGLLLEKQGDLEGAKAFCQQAIASGHADHASWAAIKLGVLLYEQGDLDGARVAWQQAVDSGHAEWAPRAANNLGNLLGEQGDLEGARVAWQQAIDSGHAVWAPRAAENLERLLKSPSPSAAS